MGADSKKPGSNDTSSDSEVEVGPDGVERRSQSERRKIRDQRKNIRFDEKGGDRRSGYARRETDEGIHPDDDTDHHENND